MFFTPLLPGGVIGTDTGTLRKQVKVKRKTQPNQSMTIDWSNPIANGLIFAYNGVTNTDLVKGSRGDKQNIAVDSIGQGTNIAASLDAVTINNVNNLPTTNNLSLFSLFTTTVSPATQSATSYYAGVFSKRTTNNTRGPAIFFAGGRLLFTSNNSVGTNTDTNLSGIITTTGRTTICVTGSLSGSVGYVNGKQSGTGIVPYWPANTDPWYIGIISSPGPTTAYLSAVHHLDLCWNRTLTAAEVASLNANPWQLFKSTPQIMVATRGIVSRPNSDLSVTNNTITIRRQINVKRKTQPQMATQIDWSNPITRGLLRLVGDATQSDAVTHTPVTKNGTVTYNKGSGYRFQPFTASSASLIDAPTDKWTVFALAYAYTASGEIGIVTRTTNGDYRQNYFLAFVNGVQPRVGHKNLVGNAYTNIGSSISATAGSLCAAAGTFDGSTMRVYTNGVLGGSVAATSPYQSAGSFAFVTQIGAFDGIQRVRPYTGRGIQVAAIWNRALSEEEIRSLSANPYQLFKSTPRTMVYTKPGGGWSYNSNTSLYDAIDEPSYNDTDAIISPNLNANPGPVKFGLDTSLDAGTYNVNVRARRTDTTGDIRATLIDSAGNVVGTSSWQTLTDIYQTYVLSVTTTATASRVGLEVRA